MSDDKQDQFNQHQEVSPRTGETSSDGLCTNGSKENPTNKGSAGSNEITDGTEAGRVLQKNRGQPAKLRKVDWSENS